MIEADIVLFTSVFDSVFELLIWLPGGMLLSKQTLDQTLVVETDLLGRGDLWQSWHGHDLAGDHDDELGAGRKAQLADRHDVAGRGAALIGIGRERILRLRHAYREMPEATGLEVLELRLDAGVAGDVGGAIDLLRDGLDLVAQLHLDRIERLEARLALVDDLDDVVRKIFRALAAVRPMRAQERLRPHALGRLLNLSDLGVGVGDELVHRDDRRNAELVDVLDVALEVFTALRDGRDILGLQVIFRDAAMHLEGADGRDDHDGRRRDAGLAALDVEEFLGSEVGAEAGLGHDVVRELQGRRRRQHRVAAVGDVGERTAVNKHGIVLQRLHEVRLQRILQQHRHGAIGFQIAGADRLLVARVGDDDVAEPLFEILQIPGEAENGHHLGCDGDVEAALARISVRNAAERIDDLAECAVVDVEDALPADAALVDAESITPVDVVVNERRQKIVCGGDRVKVAGEVQIYVFHRHDLGVTAARRAALHAEARPERRFAQRHDRFLADAVEAVAKADRRRRLAFARRRRADRRHEDEMTIAERLNIFEVLGGNFGFGPSVGDESVSRDSNFCSYVGDRL